MWRGQAQALPGEALQPTTLRWVASRWKALCCALLVLGVLSVPALASAQKHGKKVIRLEEITVEGRIQKPQAFYILPRSNLDYEGLERVESFLHKIEESVREAPF